MLHSALSFPLPKEIRFDHTVSDTPWVIKAQDERLVLALTQRLDVPDMVARVLASRGVDLENAEDFLAPTLKRLLPDPFHLKDMRIAAERLASAIEHGEKVVVFGDYDVDGATSSSLLIRYFRVVGRSMEAYIPDRLKEGYGPNTPALLKLKAQGADLVVTVDCGAVSFAPLAAAKEAGLEVIVIDHHMGLPTLPEAVAVVNPNRIDETTPHRNLAAAGVVFLLLVAVNNVLRERGYFTTRPEPKLLDLLDIVALGTVCDVMKLTGLNRALVTQGLKILAQRRNLGLRVLGDVAGMDSVPNAYHLGFVLGPRINAGGRVGKSDLGTRLLCTENEEEANAIARELNQLNQERKAIELFTLEEAILQGEQQANQPFVLVQKEGWHPGVIGIVASRLKDRFNKPAMVVAMENGIGKASARSVSGVDLGAAVASAKELGILREGGGHAMAAGFSVEAGKIDALSEFLTARLSQGVADYQENRVLACDALLSPSAVTVELVRMIERAAPFGMGNPNPRFILEGAFIASVDQVGEDHLRCMIGSDKSYGQTKLLKAMLFRAIGTPLGDALLTAKGKPCALAGQVKLNSWQGRESAEFMVEDVCF
jgi:single-stranded-DNA-specific exonuclease